MTKTPSLLIVDDSKVSRIMIRGIVENKRPEWEVVEAATGEEALEQAAQTDIDFFSFDLNMPGIDGLEAVAQLPEKYASTPKVLLTANIQDNIANRATALDVSCIHKPITEDCIDKMLEIFDG
ncbi:MAG: response regulator [Gammaproteobacteria bacterium]|nr:response regulator [Gammaproteobacteria bacterium]